MRPRYRVVIDNDFSGDPDDLFQLAHHVLSGSVEIPFVIGSHLAPGDVFDPSSHQADNAAAAARRLLALMGRDIPVYAGSNTGLPDPETPIRNAAVDALIHEALRTDTELPLFVALGAGLTELASAVLLEPRIASRLTAIWIGGPEHRGLGLPFPLPDHLEYNLAIDIPAARVVFNESQISIWQVPRSTYRQALVSRAELERRVRPLGPLGEFLADAVDDLAARAEAGGLAIGETYCLGDQPLVLLTALHTAFEPDAASSHYDVIPTPLLSPDGWYRERADGRPMRVYTRLDTRLMFEDMFAKFALFQG
ncbi:nucleoside hydrolase [Gryllotalpicola koreensis]|uniref:Inosine/uridine-preferring nucleoside hydrolase domain-containing protein n=1 Tax=Gryllotalpicola koreensis TaxID=993086 RepID=A0ABP7ZTH5_9MICO